MVEYNDWQLRESPVKLIMPLTRGFKGTSAILSHFGKSVWQPLCYARFRYIDVFSILIFNALPDVLLHIGI